jgi:HAD superfamily hydrolase (TIGR01509 family)
MTGAVLFDVDGTLVDTPYLHAVCWWEAMRQAGHTASMATIHRAVGMGSAELLDHVLGSDRDRSEDEQLKAAHLALSAQYWSRLRPLPGAADLLRACAGRGLAVVLASSANPTELAVLRSALDADDAITAATSAADAEAAKPAPDILQAALDQARVSPDDAVFVGDAVWDGIAASRLGVPFVALTCGGTSAAELREHGAVEVYQDPADLLRSLDQSAIARLAGS